jgi:hypothetical protein
MATLAQLAQAYLNQGLPSISGIFKPRGPSIPTPVPVPVAPEPGITPQLLQPMGGNEEGFSVYNPDPNMTRTSDQYSPYAYRQAAERNLIGTMGGALTGTQIPNTSTEVAKLMDMYPDYYQGKQLTGIPGAISNYAKNSLLGRALTSLANALPVNRTGILQNELLGAGFQLNNIGQIVGDPRTVEGVMAGMNTSRMDAGSFDKKSAGIEKTLSGKYGLSKSEIDSIKAGNITDSIKAKAYNKTMGTTSNLVQDLLNTEIAKNKFLDVIDKTNVIFDDKSLQKDPTYKSLDEKIEEGLLEGDDDDDDDFEFDLTDPLKIDPISKKNVITNTIFQEAVERQKQAEAQRIEDQLAAAAATKNKAAALKAIQEQGAADYNPGIHGSTNYGQDSQGNQSFSGESVGAPGLGFGIGSDGGPVSNRTGRGRTGFNKGGLADLVYLLRLK